MDNLIQGQNSPLASTTLTAQFNSDVATGKSPAVVELNAFLLGATGRVLDDPGFVFYNQPAHPSGCLSMIPGNLQYTLSLDKTPAAIERMVLTVTLDQQAAGSLNFGSGRYAELVITGGATQLSFRMDTTGMRETSLILGEFYRRNGAWKFKAVGQGFAGGLDPMAKYFGVDIGDAPAPPSSKPKPVNLSKITLDKRKPISLEKKASGDYGEVVINLNWNQKPAGGGGGLFGKMLSGKGIDLDLGCMIEFSDGNKTVVQALGNSFGSYDQMPWVHLLGDDRSGALTDGEFIKINGRNWSSFKRVLVYAFIYEGTPSWDQAQARISITMPGQPELEAHLDSHDKNKTMCAIAMIDNVGNGMQVTKLVDYFQGHSNMDDAFGFGFNWKSGRK